MISSKNAWNNVSTVFYGDIDALRTKISALQTQVTALTPYDKEPFNTSIASFENSLKTISSSIKNIDLSSIETFNKNHINGLNLYSTVSISSSTKAEINFKTNSFNLILKETDIKGAKGDNVVVSETSDKVKFSCGTDTIFINKPIVDTSTRTISIGSSSVTIPNIELQDVGDGVNIKAGSKTVKIKHGINYDESIVSDAKKSLDSFTAELVSKKSSIDTINKDISDCFSEIKDISDKITKVDTNYQEYITDFKDISESYYIELKDVLENIKTYSNTVVDLSEIINTQYLDIAESFHLSALHFNYSKAMNENLINFLSNVASETPFSVKYLDSSGNIVDIGHTSFNFKTFLKKVESLSILTPENLKYNYHLALANSDNVLELKTLTSLNNVDNTSDINKPISNLTQTAIDLKRNIIDSYTKDEVNGKISTAIGNLIDNSPTVLDTLKEIATALNNDPTFSVTITKLISDVSDKLDGDIKNLSDYVTTNDLVISGVKTDITTLNTNLNTTNTNLNTTNTNLATTNTNLTTTNTNVSNLKSSYDSFVTATNGSISSLDASVTTINTSIGNINTAIGDINSELDSKDLILSGISEDIGDINTELDTKLSTTDFNSAKSSLETLINGKSANDHSHTEFATINTSFSNVDTKLGNITTSLNGKSETTHTHTEFTGINGDISTINTSIGTINTALGSINTSVSDIINGYQVKIGEGTGFLKRNGNIWSYDNTTYITGSEVDTKIAAINFSNYATKGDVTSAINSVPVVDLSSYATESYVTTAISNIPVVNLSSYALKTDIGTAISNINYSSFITTSSLSSTLGSYYTNAEVDSLIASTLSSGTVDLTNYYTKTEVTGLLPVIDLTKYYTKTEITGLIPTIDFTGYATETYVTNAIANVNSGGTVDLTGYATEDYVTSAIANVNSSGTIDLSNYVLKSDIIVVDELALKQNIITEVALLVNEALANNSPIIVEWDENSTTVQDNSTIEEW